MKAQEFGKAFEGLDDHAAYFEAWRCLQLLEQGRIDVEMNTLAVILDRKGLVRSKVNTALF